ncbi:MAG: GNAT family N-acetyltransferase [Thermoplasmata archaeon]|nr:GNAT family N-acetyltransferase [Thermoplasmata archaeon]
MTSTIELGIDRSWLLSLFAQDPVVHAYARWDVDFAPTQCRFVTLRRGGHPASYLLIWDGNPQHPIVHWGGDPEPDPLLLHAFPPRPFVAMVPEPLAPHVMAVRGAAVASPLLLLVRERDAPVGRSRREHTVRRLARHDFAELQRVGEGQDDVILHAYRGLDPEATQVYGAFLDGRLVGIARAQVMLPEVWIVGGVFTTPSARNRGIGGDVTAALSRAAEEAGARAALVVREDNAAARRAYERIGFRPYARRVHLLAAAENRN